MGVGGVEASPPEKQGLSPRFPGVFMLMLGLVSLLFCVEVFSIRGPVVALGEVKAMGEGAWVIFSDNSYIQARGVEADRVTLES